MSTSDATVADIRLDIANINNIRRNLILNVSRLVLNFYFLLFSEYYLVPVLFTSFSVVVFRSIVVISDFSKKGL